MLTLAQIPASPDENCGCEDKPLPEVLSIVNGVKITAKDLDPATNSRVLNSSIGSRSSQTRMDLQINSMLLETEAKRTLTTTKLLEQEVVTKLKNPPKPKPRRFSTSKNRSSEMARSNSTQVKDRIMDHLRGARQQELAKQFADRLRTTADFKIFYSGCDSARETERSTTSLGDRQQATDHFSRHRKQSAPTHLQRSGRDLRTASSRSQPKDQRRLSDTGSAEATSDNPSVTRLK